LRLSHHQLCFGCGQTNVFGLMLEAQRAGDGSITGRCFVKQDHQGPDRASAHDGVVAAALCEAMAFACGPAARATTVSVQLSGTAPVGAFLELQAFVHSRGEGAARASATASFEGRPVATAEGSFATAAG
jgi:acyl-coenzyme A thioesterase PaaI-like protein